MDGRIDDANAGWKGRGLWATVSTRAPFHMETGQGDDEQSAALPVAAESSSALARSITQFPSLRPGCP